VGVLEYCARSELHPGTAGLGMLKGRGIPGRRVYSNEIAATFLGVETRAS
jgi:hypothetical protein